jgi:hypothetical protein
VIYLDVVELAYRDMRWEERIAKAGGVFLDKIRNRKCRYGLVSGISFISGIITTFVLLLVLVTIL